MLLTFRGFPMRISILFYHQLMYHINLTFIIYVYIFMFIYLCIYIFTFIFIYLTYLTYLTYIFDLCCSVWLLWPVLTCVDLRWPALTCVDLCWPVTCVDLRFVPTVSKAGRNETKSKCESSTFTRNKVLINIAQHTSLDNKIMII